VLILLLEGTSPSPDPRALISGYFWDCVITSALEHSTVICFVRLGVRMNVSLILQTAALFTFSLPFLAAAPGGYGSHGGHSSYSSHSARAGHSHASSSRCASCTRNSHGRIKRSSESPRDFKRSHPCPATGSTSGGCRGYVIDHVRPLASGGADNPSNMQWQTKAEAKAKDKWERK
jgi:hypothetical protein